MYNYIYFDPFFNELNIIMTVLISKWILTLKIQDSVPLIRYDNEWYVWVQFDKLVNYLEKGRLYLVGHYTDFGKDLRDNFLDSSALKMFWFIDSKTAYGGRAAISPLFSAILNSSKSFPKKKIQNDNTLRCKSPAAVFFRSASLLTHSKKIKISDN